eukprot:scaffold3327_cov242-Pinguiococcus_pyrenoidosus.AAC.2
MASFLPALILLPAVPRTVSICAPGVSTESTCTWHCCVSSRPVVDEAKRSSRATSQPMAAVVFRAIVRSARPKVGPSPMASSPRTQPDGFEVPGAEDADSSAVKEKEREMASRASVLVLGPRLGSYDALQSIAYSSEAPLAAAEMRVDPHRLGRSRAPRLKACTKANLVVIAGAERKGRQDKVLGHGADAGDVGGLERAVHRTEHVPLRRLHGLQSARRLRRHARLDDFRSCAVDAVRERDVDHRPSHVDRVLIRRNDDERERTADADLPQEVGGRGVELVGGPCRQIRNLEHGDAGAGLLRERRGEVLGFFG